MRSLDVLSVSLCRRAAKALTLALCAACDHPPVSASAPLLQPSNLVTNGDFSQGLQPWGAHAAGAASPQPAPEPRLENGSLCATVHGGQEIIVGWPVAGSTQFFALAAGAKYDLSLRASLSAAQPVECVIKVGHQVSPYTAAFSTRLPLGQAFERLAVAFVPDHADDRAGIAVECRAAPGSPPADVCIDDVSLSASAR